MTTARTNADMPCEDQINTGQDTQKDSRALPRPRVWARIRRPTEQHETRPPGFDWERWFGTWVEIGEPLSPDDIHLGYGKRCGSDTWWVIVGPPEFVAAIRQQAIASAYRDDLPFATCRHMLEIGD